MKRVQTIFIDFLLFLYLFACMNFILNTYTDLSISLQVLIMCSIVFTTVTQFIQDSIGQFLLIPKANKKYRVSKILLIALLAATIITGWLIVEIDPQAFFTGISNTRGIVNGLFSPDFSQLLPMLSALVETIFLALIATVLAIPFAFILSFPAARNLMPNTILGNTIYIVVRTLATFFRSVEAIIWAIIFCVWVGIGPFAGMLALMVHSIAALTKLYSEQIENIDQGPVEAITGTGATTLQIWMYAVIPQIISPYLAFTIYRWDINVRMATIVGFVGGGGIGLVLQQEQQLLRWSNVGLIIWLIALTVWIMDMISGRVRKYLMEKQ